MSYFSQPISTIEEYIKFVENFSLERRQWWPLDVSSSQQDSTLEPKEKRLEVFWRRDRVNPLWEILVDKSVTFKGNGKEFLSYLSKNHPDYTEKFCQLLKSSMLSQAVFASTVMVEAKKVLGEETVKKGIEDHRQFSEQLLQAVRGALGEDSPTKSKLTKPNLTLIKTKTP